MNKLLETFLTSIAAITIYKLLTATFNAYRYKQDDIDTPPQDFNQYDHIHLNAEVSD
ncbi:MAG: hypothetical protein QP950_03905 [Staphylococcus warneri]|uniref:hypothetical protein n=1 Tax=Staphylococcus warneri TaxID=1292 RepID=UPI000ACBE1EB|nr:hypothetical protein [Staphylococcus warneri]MCC8990599.1 hypothetical protein [Staphylococcus sp.]MCM3482263.1 hypothetical protein [Staphylococcus warneri]MCT1632273.1 hypothetical protein [Staphylococcus warneri]MCT2348250.1 hypothetical protein [Staphylococcus warneri]MCV7476676.1 hypothetical protein [Staphylococcus warneri]